MIFWHVRVFRRQHCLLLWLPASTIQCKGVLIEIINWRLFFHRYFSWSWSGCMYVNINAWRGVERVDESWSWVVASRMNVDISEGGKFQTKDFVIWRVCERENEKSRITESVHYPNCCGEWQVEISMVSEPSSVLSFYYLMLLSSDQTLRAFPQFSAKSISVLKSAFCISAERKAFSNAMLPCIMAGNRVK